MNSLLLFSRLPAAAQIRPLTVFFASIPIVQSSEEPKYSFEFIILTEFALSRRPISIYLNLLIHSSPCL